MALYRQHDLEEEIIGSQRVDCRRKVYLPGGGLRYHPGQGHCNHHRRCHCRSAGCSGGSLAACRHDGILEDKSHVLHTHEVLPIPSTADKVLATSASRHHVEWTTAPAIYQQCDYAGRSGSSPKALQASKAADLWLVCVEDCTCVGAQVVQPAAAALTRFTCIPAPQQAPNNPRRAVSVPFKQQSDMLCMTTSDADLWHEVALPMDPEGCGLGLPVTADHISLHIDKQQI